MLLGLILNLAQVQPALVDRLQRLALKLVQLPGHPFVYGIAQQQHLDAFLAEDLQVRAVPRRGAGFGRDEVNRLLILCHAPDVVLERDPLLIGLFVRAREAEQGRELCLLIGGLDHAFLQHLAEDLPEFGVFFLILFRQIL